MALAYSNISIELREISLRDRPDELYEASKKGTVPVLITTENIVIDESIEIILWSLKSNSKQIWLSDNSDSEMNLINQNDTIFKQWLDKYKYYERHPENSKEYYRQHCSNILSDYENKLKDTKYLLRDEISIADVAIFPFVRQFANVDYDWFSNNYTNLKTWLETIVLSDLFLSIMKKYDTWNREDSPQIINF